MKFSQRNEPYFYGAHPDQFARLTRPASNQPLPVLVVIHGGYWKQSHTLDSYATAEIAEYFNQQKQVAVWNIEYRRFSTTQPNSTFSWKEMVADVAHAYELLATVGEEAGLDLANITVVGHSAGGHLAAWLLSRYPEEDARIKVPPKHLVLVSAVLNLEEGLIGQKGEKQLSQPEQLTRLLGAIELENKTQLAQLCPSLRAPQVSKITLIHGEEDLTVPAWHSKQYALRWPKQVDRVCIYHNCDHFGMFQMLDWPELKDKPNHWPAFVATLTQIIESP